MLLVPPAEYIHITALHPIALEGAGSPCWYGGDHRAPVQDGKKGNNLHIRDIYNLYIFKHTWS